jgi:small-conductance mechanosensitive channel
MASDTPALAGTYDILINGLQTTYRELIDTTAVLLPNLLGAVLIVLIGWAVAWLLRLLILRLGSGLDRLFELAKRRTGQRSVELRWPLSRITAYSVYWLVIVFFLTAATKLLNLPGVTELFSGILFYLPVLLLTAAVLLVVYLVSGFIGDVTARSARRAGLAKAAGLGRLIRILIVVVAVIIAIGHIGVDTTLPIYIVTVLAATSLGGAAIAFGMGAAVEVQNIIASHRVRKHYNEGQRIRIGDIEGEIVEITREAIVIDAKEGRTNVPARLLSEGASVLLDDDERRA